MRRDPDGRFGHIALAARARRRHCFCVCWTCYEEEDPGRRRRRRRSWLFMVATWSKSRSYRRNGQIGREGENERERVREWGTRWERGREDGRHVGVLLGKWPRVSSRTFACRGDKRSPSKWFYRTVLEF